MSYFIFFYFIHRAQKCIDNVLTDNKSLQKYVWNIDTKQIASPRLSSIILLLKTTSTNFAIHHIAFFQKTLFRAYEYNDLQYMHLVLPPTNLLCKRHFFV